MPRSSKTINSQEENKITEEVVISIKPEKSKATKEKPTAFDFLNWIQSPPHWDTTLDQLKTRSDYFSNIL